MFDVSKEVLFFQKNGFLKIDSLFEPELIDQLQCAFSTLLDTDVIPQKHKKQLGPGRYIVNIEFKGVFNNPKIYANPFLASFLSSVLGPCFKLSAMGVVLSLPGADEQHIHADFFPLFEEGPGPEGAMPAYAITVAIPLVDIDPLNGPTKVWAGTHLEYPRKNLESYPRTLLMGPKGCCYLWDYRTLHAGGSNFSDQRRPLFYLSYRRRWFQDPVNPDQLLISDEEFQKIPPDIRQLFAVLKP